MPVDFQSSVCAWLIQFGAIGEWNVFAVIPESPEYSFNGFFVGMWRHFARVWYRFVHRHQSCSNVAVDWCKQRQTIAVVASVFLLHCARISCGWISGNFVLVHWMVGNVLEQLLHIKYCMEQFDMIFHFFIQIEIDGN